MAERVESAGDGGERVRRLEVGDKMASFFTYHEGKSNRIENYENIDFDALFYWVTIFRHRRATRAEDEREGETDSDKLTFEEDPVNKKMLGMTFSLENVQEELLQKFLSKDSDM
jgi:hypothetical protein